MSQGSEVFTPVVTPEQAAHLLEIGYRDYLEGLEWMAQQRGMVSLEQRFPGLDTVFDRLIELLPSPWAETNTEFPVAASVIKAVGGKPIEVVATARNGTNRLRNSHKHAETIVLEEAMDKTGDKHLDGHVLVSTTQCCMACTGNAINDRVDGVIYGASHNDLRGSHALVNREYKPWRTVREGIDLDEDLRDSGLFVIAGFRKNEVLARLKRSHGSWASYYQDPDS